MKRNILQFTFFVTLLSLCLSLGSCKKLKEWGLSEPDDPSENPALEGMVEGDIDLNSTLTINDYPSVEIKFNEYEIYFPYDHNAEIVDVGWAYSITSIRRAPQNGWSSYAELKNDNGYVICYVDNGVPNYIRLLIKLNKTASAQVVGVHYIYQKFTPSKW